METTQASFDHSLWKNPIGEAHKDALRLNSDRKVKLEFHRKKVASDASLLAYRELDDVLGLTSATDPDLCDIRTVKNTQHGLAALLRQSIQSRLETYGDTSDAERLILGHAMRHVAFGRVVERSAASTSAMTKILTQLKNLEYLTNSPLSSSCVFDNACEAGTMDCSKSVSVMVVNVGGVPIQREKEDSSLKYVAFPVFNATRGAGFLGN
ncbi:MAG: transposase [Sedimentisphaerales bacterium]|jgi:hypothetical protein